MDFNRIDILTGVFYEIASSTPYSIISALQVNILVNNDSWKNNH